MSSPSPAAAPTEPSRALGWCLGALLALVLALYARTAGHEFVGYDDTAYVTENEMVVRGLTLDGLAWSFGARAGNWHPLTWWSHMLDVQLFGLSSAAHHLVNAVLHAAVVGLLFVLVRRLTGAGWSALLVAAWFGLHPLRVESVAWVSERKDLLCALFWMLCLLAWERFARRGGSGRYALVLVALALALMSKPMAVTLPVVLLLLQPWPLAPRAGLRPLVAVLPCAALALAAGAATFWIQRAGGAVGTLQSLSWLERVSNACASYGTYVLQSLWPVDLACFVPHPVAVTPRDELTRALFLPGLACLAGLALVTLLAFRARRARPHLWVGWTWYLVTALPVIGLVQVGQQAHADRYTYLPTIGLALALAFELRARVERRPELRTAVAATCALSALALVPLTWRQIGTWKDGRTLFAHALAVTEKNYLAATFLGMTERREGKLEEARAHLERALADNKYHVQAMLELGLTLRELGELRAAARLLKRTLRNAPENAEARSALAEVEAALGERVPDEDGE